MEKTQEPKFFSHQVAQARRFYTQKSDTSDSSIQVVCGGCEHTNPDFKIDRGDFPYYCIEFVAKGKGRATLNNRDFDLEPGTFFSYGPGISQHIESESKKPMVKYFIDFTGTAGKRILRKYISPLGTAIQISRPDEIIPIFDDLLTQGLSDNPFRSMTCSTLLEYLLYRVAAVTSTQTDSPTRAYLTYQQCRHYIKEHFIDLHSLHDIADACVIDNAYLCRLFKRFDIQSPYQYLMNQKMAYAADRFQQAGVLVKEVAHELGFSDPFHFTRVFKKVFGISPQAFKELR